MTTVEINNKDTFDLLFKDSNPKEKRVFVDVGGYDGDTVKKALDINPNLRVIVIEPIKALADVIQQKFQSNNNVTVINKAAWNSRCTISFNEYEGWSKGLSTLQPTMTQLRPTPQFTNKILKYNVEADTLDGILSDLNIGTVDYLKIDTEGSEEQVLAGFTKYHSNTRFHVEHHIINLSNILQKLQEMNNDIDIEIITLARDTNIKEHVVGAVIGKFVTSSKHEKIATIHAGNDRVKYLLDRAIKNKAKILNVGCTDNFMFRDTDLDVMNIDITDEIPEAYRSKTKFKIADAHNLPFADDEFNCTILGEILEHVKDPIQVLREAKRVSKNVYITVPNEYDWDKILNPFQNPAHIRHYTYESLKEDLDRAYGKDNTKIIQYDGGGWSFFCAEYETDTEYKGVTKIENIKQELIITEGPIISTGPIFTEGPMTDIKYPLSRNVPLRIALISTPFFTLPPKGYSGLEQVTWDLAEALDELGHEVTLFAPEGSQPTKHGHLIVTGPSISTVNVDWFLAEKNAYGKYKDLITPYKYDVIHDHSWFSFIYLSKINNPKLRVCHTNHGGYTWETAPPFPKPNLISISKWMKDYTEQYFKQRGFNIKSEYVHNGIDLNKYTFDPNIKRINRLLYIGRFSRFKQPDMAIRIAKTANLPIDLIGGTFVDDTNYLKNIESICDGKDIVIYKDAPHEFKIKKLQEAKALIVPSNMNEPFGLTCIEGMACGTVPITTRDGAIPETVLDRETGFICDTEDQMIEAIKNIDKIDPLKCRKHVEDNFSRIKMAKNYEKLYYKTIKGEEW